MLEGWCQTGCVGGGGGGCWWWWKGRWYSGNREGGRLSRVPPHVNYLLFALDNPEARCAARNENPESQGLHLKKRGGQNNAVVITTSSVRDQ